MTKESRMRKITILCLAMTLMIMELFVLPREGGVVKASDISIPGNAKEYRGHYYKVYKASRPITWSKAKQYCEAKGGHLVTMTSAGETTFVEGLTNGSSKYWIGASRKNGKFKWITGEKWSYGKVSASYYSEVYLDSTTGKWSTAGYWTVPEFSHYICEWDTSRETVLPDQVKLSNIKKATASSVILSWKKVSGAKGYTIYMKTGVKGTYKKIADIKNGNITAFYKTKLKKGKTYYFRVRAYKKIYGERSYGELSVQKGIKIK